MRSNRKILPTSDRKISAAITPWKTRAPGKARPLLGRDPTWQAWRGEPASKKRQKAKKKACSLPNLRIPTMAGHWLWRKQQAATFRASTGQTLGETKQATTSNDRPGQVERPKLSLRSLPYVYTDPEPLLCANEDKLQHDSMRREHSLILKAALPLTPATSSELRICTTRDTSFDLPIRNHSGWLLELLAMQEQDRVPTWRTWVANRPGDLHVAEVKDRSQAREKGAVLPRRQCTHPIRPLL